MLRKSFKKKQQKNTQSGVILAEPTLHMAAMQNDVELAKKILETSEDKDIDCRDKYGTTPLHHAVYNQSVEMVKFLVENGADVNARIYGNWIKKRKNCRMDLRGYTPLSLTQIEVEKWTPECLEMAIILIESKEIDFNIRIRDGRYYHKSENCIDYFERFRNYQVLEMIEKRMRKDSLASQALVIQSGKALKDSIVRLNEKITLLEEKIGNKKPESQEEQNEDQIKYSARLFP